jgi:hypothetical protein
MLFLAQDVMSTDGTERVIYYISRILNDSKTRYTYIEKLCYFTNVPSWNIIW